MDNAESLFVCVDSLDRPDDDALERVLHHGPDFHVPGNLPGKR